MGNPNVDVEDLFPHPLHWRIKTAQTKTKVTKRTARIVLATMRDYPECKIALSHIMTDIHAAIIQ